MNLLSIGAAYGILVAIFQWGWGMEPDRRRQVGSDRGLGADVPVRHRVRPVDGLRGVPPVADQGGVRPHQGQRRRRRRRPGRHGPGDHRRRADHVLRVRRLRPRRRPPAQAVRPRPGRSPSLLDATIVRMVLVPATMELLGDRNWWLPKWLDRILPKISVEGKHHIAPCPPTSCGDGEAERRSRSPSSSDPPTRSPRFCPSTLARSDDDRRTERGVGVLG